jgi:Xaa-Pro aminopeptidase
MRTIVSAPRILAAAAAVLTMMVAVPPLQAQTPEQKYTDWARLDFKPQEYEFRRDRLTDHIRESGGGILLIPGGDGAPHGGTFRQLDDFWYLTGLEVPGSMLVLDSDRPGGSATLFMPTRDARFENPGRRNDFPGRPLLDDYELRGIAGVGAYRDISELDAFLRERVAAGTPLRVNSGRSGEVPAPEPALLGVMDPIASMIFRLRADYPGADFINAFESMARVRMIKSPAEIQHMQIAADATMAGIRAGADRVRVGVDERTIQGAFEEACREFGSAAIPFTPIIKSGPNSLWPWRVLAAHYDRRNRPMESDELVILDVGCEVDGYISDVGRTFPVGGTFTDIQREKMLVSTNAADAIIAAVRPGVTLAELTAIAYENIPDHEEQYMQTPSYFGHHIGLSSGDPALMDIPLEAGMVFTVEPWYYNHDIDIAVFVEDVILVTEDGAEVLTSALPRTPEELEAMIR